MINQLFTLPSTIERLRQGPLSEHLDAYAAAVAEQGYVHHSIGRQIVAIADFSRWLKHKHIAIEGLDDQVVDRFLRLASPTTACWQRRPESVGSDVVHASPEGHREAVSAASRGQRPFQDRRRVSAAICCRNSDCPLQRLKNYVPFIEQFLMERFQNRTPDLAGCARRMSPDS